MAKKASATLAKREQPNLADVFTRLEPTPKAKPNTFDPVTREVEIVISTGASVRRWDWEVGDYEEVLEISPTAIRMERMNQGAALLDSHNYWGGLSAMIGSIVPNSVRIEGKALVGRVKLSRSEIGERVARDLIDGIQFQASAGYKVHSYTTDLTVSPAVRRVTDWEPLEVSVVTVAAESVGTGFRGEMFARHPDGSASQEEQRTMNPILRRRGESDVDFAKRVLDGFKQAYPKDNEAALKKRAEEYLAAYKRQEAMDSEAEDDEEAKKKKAADEEAARSLAATQQQQQPVQQQQAQAQQAQPQPHVLAAEFMSIGQRAEMPIADITQALRDGVSIEAFRTRAFDLLAERSRKPGINGGNGAGADGGNAGADPSGGYYGETHTGRNPLVGRSAAMVEAMVTRILSSRRVPVLQTQDQADWAKRRGLVDRVTRAWQIYDGHEKPENPQAVEFMGKSLVELAAICTDYRGHGLITARRAEEILARAFHTTSDFPLVLENTMNKALLARYQLAMPTYRQLAIQRNFADFRPHNQYRIGDFPQLQAVRESGELASGSTQESKETVSVKPYGVIFSITRQVMVNDDMGAIDQLLGGTGDEVLRFENRTFFAMFLSNPVLLTDSIAVWAQAALGSGGHGNYADTHAHGGDPPNISTVSAGRKVIRDAKSLSGEPLNLAPSIIFSGSSQETVIEQLTATINPNLTTSVNPFSGKLRPVIDAAITGLDWFLFAEPTVAPCFVYGFLDGFQGPRTRTDEPFGMQGMRISLEHDFGCGAIDYRGTYRNGGLTS